MSEWWTKVQTDFQLNFIEADRYKSIISGLGVTLKITFFAVIIGIAIGIVVASVRSTYDMNVESMRRNKTLGYYVLSFFDIVCKVYLTIIRGTPTMVQLLICYFIIFTSSTNDIGVAIFTFGINSGAYVAEIIRGGIMAIPRGQFEAGRSLGFDYVRTMLYIIIPQVFKEVLPALCNEFIVLIKETSIAGYIGVVDLTKAGDLIRGRTFSAFMPLIAVALIYLVLVCVLALLFGRLERRLRKDER